MTRTYFLNVAHKALPTHPGGEPPALCDARSSSAFAANSDPNSGCRPAAGSCAAEPCGCPWLQHLLELLLTAPRPVRQDAEIPRQHDPENPPRHPGGTKNARAMTTSRLVVECLNVFNRRGNPRALASLDLLDELVAVPGIAGSGWTYASLTPARLAELLAPHGVHPRNVCLPDGQRRKGYTRSALAHALHSMPL